MSTISKSLWPDCLQNSEHDIGKKCVDWGNGNYTYLVVVKNPVPELSTSQ